jgi:hypothetical protein
MMPTCRDIITRALRKARVYAAGETPSDDDMADGLDELQNLYEQWGSNGMFGRLADVLTADDYEASPNERITVTDAATVTIPTSFETDGEDYPAYDTAFIEVVDVDAGTVTRYLWESGAWVEISGLGLNDEAPLAGKGRSGLAACLAIPLAEEFGTNVGPGVARQAGAFKTGLSLKYGSDAQRTASDYF